MSLLTKGNEVTGEREEQRWRVQATLFYRGKRRGELHFHGRAASALPLYFIWSIYRERAFHEPPAFFACKENARLAWFAFVEQRSLKGCSLI